MRFATPIQLLKSEKVSDGMGGYSQQLNYIKTVFGACYNMTSDFEEDFFKEKLTYYTIIFRKSDVEDVDFNMVSFDLKIFKIISKQTLRDKVILKGVEQI